MMVNFICSREYVVIVVAILIAIAVMFIVISLLPSPKPIKQMSQEEWYEFTKMVLEEEARSLEEFAEKYNESLKRKLLKNIYN